MKEFLTILSKTVPFFELACMLIAISQFKKVKDSYWKWFVFYLIFIVIVEFFSYFFLQFSPNLRKYFFDLFVIPVEFIFFYWLYAKKSLQNEKLFKICCFIYLAFFIVHLFILDSIRIISSMSYTIGVLLLAIMVYLEFIKQIESDEILNYKTNKMFYINVGVLLFYVGTLPFFAFDKLLFENNKYLWNLYYCFFLVSVNVMYILFAASFLWGKQKS